MDILMWVAVAVAVIFGGLGLRGGVTSDDSGAAKCYRIAGGGAVVAFAVIAYQYFSALLH